MRALKKMDGAEGRISGQILLVHRDLSGTSTRAPQPVPDITVRVVKDSVQTTATSPGQYCSVENRGAGRYSVNVEVPPRFYTDTEASSVTLEQSNQCVEVNVAFSHNGRVKGRVVDAVGRAVAGLTIELATTNLTQSRRSITDREGRYELNRLPPGRFSSSAPVLLRRRCASPRRRVRRSRSMTFAWPPPSTMWRFRGSCSTPMAPPQRALVCSSRGLAKTHES